MLIYLQLRNAFIPLPLIYCYCCIIILLFSLPDCYISFYIDANIKCLREIKFINIVNLFNIKKLKIIVVTQHNCYI